METQNKLELGIGTKEIKALGASPVTIVTVEVQEVKKQDGTVVGDKVICMSKHPDKAEAIAISTVKYEKGNQIKESGMWLSLDEDGMIRKGSALAVLLEKLGATNIKEIEGKEVNTVIDDKGFLAFKAY